MFAEYEQTFGDFWISLRVDMALLLRFLRVHMLFKKNRDNPMSISFLVWLERELPRAQIALINYIW